MKWGLLCTVKIFEEKMRTRKWKECDLSQIHCISFTFLQEIAAVRIAVLPLQGRAVPAVLLELELAFVDGQLQTSDGGRHDVGVAKAELQLLFAEAREILANGAGRPRFAALSLHHRIEEIFVLFLASLLIRLPADIHQRITAQQQIRTAHRQRRLPTARPSVIRATTCMTVIFRSRQVQEKRKQNKKGKPIKYKS